MNWFHKNNKYMVNKRFRKSRYELNDLDDVELEHQLMLERSRYVEWVFSKGHKPQSNKIPTWFTDGIKQINVKFIETQRILTINKKESNSYINNVKYCSNELCSLINTASQKAAEVTLSLDSSYPNRLISKLKQRSNESFEELNDALVKLDKRRKSLFESGLTVDTKDSAILQISEGQEDLVTTLKLYVDDSHEKLDPYEELSKKIRLFKGIINKRFKHKRLVIDQLKGMSFVSNLKSDEYGNPEEIPPSKLSSGEQNELILFFKLIFDGEKGDVILIDEPELSLHISWQNNFINDLKEVTSINDVYVIIATHSPDIIDENWDLKVGLKGVE
ncbi:TPA: AAA family ATPase [Photobacterium damselae]